MKINNWMGLVVCLLPTLLLAQTDSSFSVRGRVSTTGGKSLANVVVIIATSSKGTTTDQNGFYLLADVPREATLVFVHTGYKQLSQSLSGKQQLLNQYVLDAVLEIEREELPPMASTAAYKAIKLNKTMPVVATLPGSATQTSVVFEQKAYFPTGIPGLMRYVAHHLNYPAPDKSAKVQGDVIVEFTVSPSGAVDQVNISQGLHPACDKEAIRLVKQMPKWIPAYQSGQPVSTVFLLPVRFAIE
ncbi:TonB family protein [Spirosoma pomorum]